MGPVLGGLCKLLIHCCLSLLAADQVPNLPGAFYSYKIDYSETINYDRL